MPARAASAAEGQPIAGGPPWHAITSDRAAAACAVDPAHGLTDGEAAGRLTQNGPNELEEQTTRSPWRILWEQVSALMTAILIVAATAKLALGDFLDGAAIAAVVAVNVVLGFVQELRAEKAMAALRRLSASVVRVRRGGRVLEVDARQLVAGDLILLEAGNSVPADARLLESSNLRVQEASLTGESVPVEKNAAAVAPENAPLGDRHNMVYRGTAVTYGRASAMVIATGMRTELGRIAALLQATPQIATPLQRRVRQLGVSLAMGVVAVVSAVIALGVFRGRPAGEMFLSGVAIAIAAIPEGLPAVLTITLALGAQRMMRRRALMRKLAAVETLGSVTVICSDKTGTLTENRMTVVLLDAAGVEADVAELISRGHPVVPKDDRPLPPASKSHELLLTAAAACNDAVLQRGETGDIAAVGDPTEGALLVAAAHFGIWKAEIDDRFRRVAEEPFSSDRKRMSTVHIGSALADMNEVDEVMPPGSGATPPYVQFTKGSVDGLLSISTSVVGTNGIVEPMTDARRDAILSTNDRLAARGLRVLGVALRPIAEARVEERALTFIGLAGMVDPPRAEVKTAVANCLTAGIRPVMITGDHPLTAQQIGVQLGIAGENATVVTGQELQAMSADDLDGVVGRASIFARVSPQDKLNIVNALQRQGHVVAMTGDGVNDAPALSKSDIGVAMGITGTDVAKEASDMVITDDNFATIVSAIEQGRTIYDNVRKFVKYIVTSNSGEVLLMLLTQIFAMPIPMTTLQILWMNLVTDGVPGLALGVEPAERGVMTRPPHSPGESIFSRGLGRHVMIMGPLLALVTFGVGYWGWSAGNPAWGTMVFVTLTFSQLGHALAVRTNFESLFTAGWRGNPLLIAAIAVTLALQLLVVYTDSFRKLFGTVPLSLTELAICLVASTAVFWAVEVEKLILRRTR